MAKKQLGNFDFSGNKKNRGTPDKYKATSKLGAGVK